MNQSLRLRSWSALALLGFRVIASLRAAEPDRVMVTPEILYLLAAQYREEGLPIPPTDAPLMLVPSGGNGESILGFQLEAGKSRDKPGAFLIGTEAKDVEIGAEDEAEPPRLIQPDEKLTSHLDSHPGLFSEYFPVNVWLAIAIQCHLRGNDGLARQLFEKGLTRDETLGGPTAVSAGHGWLDPRVNRSMAEPAAGISFRESLAATAWNHWMNFVVQPGADRQEALERMTRLAAEFPALRGPSQQAFLESLRLTLQPGKGAPNSIEGLIDGLTELAQNSVRIGISQDVTDPKYAKIEGLGFAAVPALIDHLDDRRLTRSVIEGFDNFPTLPRRVGDVAGDLIEGLAEPELASDWLSRQLGNFTARKAVLRWWKKASKTGEEAYVVEHVFQPKTEQGRYLNKVCLGIIAARYAQHLGPIYHRLLSESGIENGQEITELICKAKGLLPEEKIRLLREGAENHALDYREDALGQLLILDPSDAEARLEKELDRLPDDMPKSYWTCPEARITHLVMQTPSPAVWQAFKRAVQRAKVGLRLELMQPLDYTYIGGQQKAERLTLLAAFLDDKTERTIKGNKFDGPCAGMTFPIISVQNFAAMQMASILPIDETPKADWNPSRWAKFRERVRAEFEHGRAK